MAARGARFTADGARSCAWIAAKRTAIEQKAVRLTARATEAAQAQEDKVTGGASSDLQSASNVSEYMVKKLGMSEKVGLRIYNDRDNDHQSSTSKEVRRPFNHISMFHWYHSDDRRRDKPSAERVVQESYECSGHS